MPTYYVKPGAHIRGDVEDVAAELTTLGGGAGGVTPERVVLAAHNKDKFPSLHAQFEWNNTEAARKYRLGQASYLLRSIEVVYEEQPDAEPFRAFVSVNVEEQSKFVPTRDALSNPELKQQILDRAAAELKAFRRKYAHLKEFGEVLEAINRLTQQEAA